MDPIIEFKDVSHRYQNGQDVLSRLSFSLAHGEMAFLTGASGAGKSTLLKAIAAMLRPSSGQVIVGGADLAQVVYGALLANQDCRGAVEQPTRQTPLLSERAKALGEKHIGYPGKARDEQLKQLRAGAVVRHEIGAAGGDDEIALHESREVVREGFRQQSGGDLAQRRARGERRAQQQDHAELRSCRPEVFGGLIVEQAAAGVAGIGLSGQCGLLIADRYFNIRPEGAPKGFFGACHDRRVAGVEQGGVGDGHLHACASCRIKWRRICRVSRITRRPCGAAP